MRQRYSPTQRTPHLQQRERVERAAAQLGDHIDHALILARRDRRLAVPPEPFQRRHQQLRGGAALEGDADPLLGQRHEEFVRLAEVSLGLLQVAMAQQQIAQPEQRDVQVRLIRLALQAAERERDSEVGQCVGHDSLVCVATAK